MQRQFPSGLVQTQSHALRENLCRLDSPRRMAEVSSHLRNFAVAEVLALIGRLDGHPGLRPAPVVARGAAAFQQARGRASNPLTHVAPSNLTLNGVNLTQWFRTKKAQDSVERIFGMGVMAPSNWDTLPGFDIRLNPQQLNITDNIAEGFSRAGGLVDAFERSALAAVAEGRWSGDGKPRRNNQATLMPFVERIYRDVWQPGAAAAYLDAIGHLNAKLAEAGNDQPRRERIQRRLELANVQLDLLGQDTANLSEAVRNVLDATTNERW